MWLESKLKEVFEVEASGHVGCDLCYGVTGPHLCYWVMGPSRFKWMPCPHLQESSWTAWAWMHYSPTNMLGPIHPTTQCQILADLNAELHSVTNLNLTHFRFSCQLLMKANVFWDVWRLWNLNDVLDKPAASVFRAEQICSLSYPEDSYSV